MRVTASQLRADLYNLLDRVLASGEALEVERKGSILRIVPDGAPNWMERLVVREDVVAGDSDDLVHVDWSADWKPPEP